jgi:hypothetical protein
MREQKPSGSLKLFKGFSGYASRFLLSDNRVALPTPNYLITNPWVNVQFDNIEMTAIENQGSIG